VIAVLERVLITDFDSNFPGQPIIIMKKDSNDQRVIVFFIRCKDDRVMLGGRCILERRERAGWLTPVRRGKRLTLFKRDDIEAAQLCVTWGELP
jgi:hypothetical protein